MASSDGDGENSSEDANSHRRLSTDLASSDNDEDDADEFASPSSSFDHRFLLTLPDFRSQYSAGRAARPRRLASVITTSSRGVDGSVRRQPLASQQRERSRSPITAHMTTFRRIHDYSPLLLSDLTDDDQDDDDEDQDDDDGGLEMATLEESDDQAVRYSFPTSEEMAEDDQDTQPADTPAQDDVEDDEEEEEAEGEDGDDDNEDEEDEDETAASTQVETEGWSSTSTQGDGMEVEDDGEGEAEEDEEDVGEETAVNSTTTTNGVQQREIPPVTPATPLQQKQQQQQQQQQMEPAPPAEGLGLVGCLLEILECPVCYEAMRPPIWQCSRGHLVCKDCAPRLRRCPSCRCGARRTRNYPMEKVCEKLQYPCRFHGRGCNVKLPPAELEAHERASCAHRDSACRVPRCTWRGLDTQLRAHARAAHASLCRRCWPGSPVTIRVPVLGSSVRHCRLLDIASHVFFVHFLVDGSSLSACVQLFGPPLQACNFEYRLELDEGRHRQKVRRDQRDAMQRIADIQERITFFQARLRHSLTRDDEVSSGPTEDPGGSAGGVLATSARVLDVEEDPEHVLRGCRAWRMQLSRARRLAQCARSAKTRVRVTVFGPRVSTTTPVTTTTTTTTTTTAASHTATTAL